MKAKATKKKAAKATGKRAPAKAKPKKAPPKKAKAATPTPKRAKKAAASPKPASAPPAKAPTRVTRARGKKKASRGSLAARRKRFAAHRDALLRKQADLMQAYTLSKGESQSHLDSGTEDYIDYAVNSYAREFLLSLSELDRKQLLLVEEALRRIDRGEYGDCQQCGEPIAPKRLEVAPWVRHCVRCQELEEKGLLPQTAYGMQGDDDLEDREDEEEEYETDENDDVEDEDDDESPASTAEEGDGDLDDDSELSDDDEEAED